MREVLFASVLLFSACECRGPRIVQRPDAGCVEEICDGLDNDCDGEVDEAMPMEWCGVGACARSVATCVSGVPQRCEPGTPSDEACDGLDNDCDDAIDEELGTTACGVGACARTIAACGAGACVAGAPTAELCDDLDNDCDGEVDEGACPPPLVMCPAMQTLLLGDSVTFTANAMDEDGTIVNRDWSLAMAPTGSTVTVQSTGDSVTFTPDVAGRFVASFCATDNHQQTTCCEASLEVSACASPPAPPASTACGTSWDGRPIVQFAPVPAGLQYQLTRAGEEALLATATAGHNFLRPAARVASGGAIPGTPTALELRACRTNDAACCSVPTTLTVDVVESCSTPTAPTSANVVLSEYVTNGDGLCPSENCTTRDTCQAGESIEITNLSNCPVSLEGFHFAYRNANASSGSYRWMNFGASDVIPPRGVYVAIRNRQFSTACGASLGVESAGLYGLRISSLSMQGPSLCSGWFNNSGGGLSELRVAPGTVNSGSPTFNAASAIARIAPYYATSGTGCPSIGFDAVDSCGTVVGGSTPSTQLRPNQLGRLWHPCDAVVGAVPACVRD